ncbi:MAG TPA: PQQ-binding-like beta-propeller repeat protein [Verrucomicrobiae bacterium]|jgi:outer membrane protein assembly factor BamB|nr:PQQ-binding-like beta-propeller repeat protein [Verrucomicrobiae bacterium]
MQSLSRVILLTLAGLVSPLWAADWPDFRGPWADGRASAQGDTNRIGLPLHWSETENVTWKTPIHDKGWSTPVVLRGQIWLTTATADGHDFFAIAVDQATGKILCDKKIFHCAKPEPLGNDMNGYASPSPVIEPGRVYVHFGSYGTACLDTTNFNVLWQRDDLPCRHYRGPGSSPIIYRNLLILTMDGIDVQYVTALDKFTGKTVWKTDRTTAWNDLGSDGQPMGGGDYRKSFSTPLVIDTTNGAQMLTAGSKAIYGYDPATGRELWKVRHEGYSPASRPLYDHGLAYIATGNGKGETLALRVDGRGDVTDSAVVWRVSRASPRMPSAVLADGMLFMVTDAGIGSCVDAATGNEFWRERIGGEYAASALYGDGHIYVFNQQGKATVLNASRAFDPMATNQLAAGFMASPAVSGRALYLRTKTDLYRIEEKP